MDDLVETSRKPSAAAPPLARNGGARTAEEGPWSLSPRPDAWPRWSDAMDDQAYVEWLRKQSMLEKAGTMAGRFSATASTSHNPFAIPNPRAAIASASVWFTAYPMSMVTKPGCSFLATLGDSDLWTAFHDIG